MAIPSSHYCIWAIATALVLCAMMQAGCAVSWRSGGQLHSLGAIAYKTVSSGAGIQRDRTELGVSVRLAAPERGLTIGYKATREIEPRVIEVNNAATLSAQILQAAAAAQASPAEKAESISGFFYERRPLTTLPHVLHAHYAGLDLSAEALSGGVGSSLRYLNFPMDGPGSAQLHTMHPGAETLTLWLVRSAPNRTSSLQP